MDKDSLDKIGLEVPSASPVQIKHQSEEEFQ